MKLLVTGATGYIGRHLLRLSLQQGHDVIACSRANPHIADVEWVQFDLYDPVAIDVARDVTAVVHLAADTSSQQDADAALERQSLKVLLDAAQQVGAKFIFISSQTANPEAATAYGRRKWHLERDVLTMNGVVVRVGQVYGGEPRGLFGDLVDIVLRSPIIPAFLPAPEIQPIHVDDLAAALLRIAASDRPSEILHLAEPDPVSFTRFLHCIAEYRLRKRRFSIPIPTAVIKLLGKVDPDRTRRASWQRLCSLFSLRAMDTRADLESFEICLRPIASGMCRSGSDRRRRLLREAHALFVYLLGKKLAGGAQLRRYVRTIETLRDGRALRIPRFFVNHPAWAPILERIATRNWKEKSEFLWRLNAATLLVEATPEGRHRFIGPVRASFPRAAWQVSLAVASELMWRMSGLLIHFFAKFNSSSEIPQRSQKTGREQ